MSSSSSTFPHYYPRQVQTQSVTGNANTLIVHIFLLFFLSPAYLLYCLSGQAVNASIIACLSYRPVEDMDDASSISEVFQQETPETLIKSNNVQQRISSLWVKHNILGSKINTGGRFKKKKCVSNKICKRRTKLINQFSFTTIQTHN